MIYRMANFPFQAVLLAVCGVISCARGRSLDEIRYSFSTCGNSGRNGPSIRSCRNNYTKQSPLIRDNVLFGFGDNDYTGAQGFKVPRSGLYNITVAGAAGGRGVCNFEYGRGLVVEFQECLSSGFEVLVLVGQKGLSPCDVNPSHQLCESPPATFEQSMECSMQWNHSLTGGVGGGGASMLWKRNVTSGVFEFFPLVVAGGGGGSSAILNYNITDLILLVLNYTTGNDLGYRELLNAKATRYDPDLHTDDGGRGYKYTNDFLISGVGGGFFQDADGDDEDGGILNDREEFAKGGFDCIRQFSAATFEFEGVYGGFGGGGGGCGEGGGGGGYTGGDVLFLGNGVPGGGGYSTLYGFMDIPESDFSLNDGDGYVEMVPVDCGCVYECVVSGEEFECMCPSGTELAPDLDDCYKAAKIRVSSYSTLNLTTSDDIQYLALQFNNKAGVSYNIFSIDAILKTNTQPEEKGRAARQSDSEGACVISFLGDNSEIVLVSNHIRGTGRIATLAEVTRGKNKDGNFTFDISDYTDFLPSSVLVTGAILISTGSCSVEEMAIAVNTSIQAVDAGPADFDEFLQLYDEEDISAFANTLLPLEVMPSTSTDDDGGSDQSVVIGVVVSIVILIVIVAVVVAVLLLIGYRYRQHHTERNRKVSAMVPILESPEVTTTGYVNLNVEPKSPRSTEISEHEMTAPIEDLDRGYETLQFEGEDESEFKQEPRLYRKFASKHGVSSPNYDFTEFNKQRTDSVMSDWEYPRCNLIYMRVLGEGQFGKVLLMKAQSIAGYNGKIPVAVKTLSTTSSEVVGKFMEEAELMKKFSHPNIVSLLGICAADSDEDSAPLMILEYMPYGDLQGFLESHRPTEQQASLLKESHFYSFAIDVAKAMEFLSSNKYVHRDLAARNCLVGSGLKIKIADFGLARGVYDKDYYRVAGRAILPVRWMAPENLLYGIFTTASDVWAYGVLLWEIVTYGEFPLQEMEPQDIVEEAQRGTLQHLRPANCPDALYGVMMECHKHDKDKRPTFTEILIGFEKQRSDTEASVAV